MEVNGNIKVQEFYNPLTGKAERVDYRWEGGDVTEISICCLLDMIGKEKLSAGDTFEIGPFRLRVAEFMPLQGAFKVVRIRGAISYLLFLWHRWGYIPDLIYRRLIITATVWNLAVYQRGNIPSWRDIKLVHRILKK